jgi:AGCS family alanine or glycine:cation symporter
MWGIFQVFLDTIVLCTVTALVILCSGTLSGNKDGAALSAAAFSTVFGQYGGVLVALCISLFAFATLLGWSYYGECGVRYLLGRHAVPAYRILFALSAMAGCTLNLRLVWEISDIFNSLMAFPNLIALFLLSGEVLDETANYLSKCRQRKTAEGKRPPLRRLRREIRRISPEIPGNKF